MTRKLLRIALAAVMLLSLVCAPALAKVVSPGSDYYYLDQANVLSEELEGEIYFSNQLLSEACGAQIVVVALNTTGSTSIDDYAYDLFNEWDIGASDRSNGLLILLAIDDDDYYVEPGTGLRSKLSAGAIKDYNDRYLESDFAAKRYEAGVKKLFEAFFARIAETYGADVTTAQGIAAYEDFVSSQTGRNAVDYGGYVQPTRSRSSSSGGSGLGLIIVVLLIILVVASVKRSSRRRAVRRTTSVADQAASMYVADQILRGAARSAVRTAARTAYRPTRVVTHSRPTGGSGLFGGSSFGSSSRSSGSSFRSSGSSSFRSSGFGGGHGGGGGTRGGGAGRGRH